MNSIQAYRDGNKLGARKNAKLFVILNRISLAGLTRVGGRIVLCSHNFHELQKAISIGSKIYTTGQRKLYNGYRPDMIIYDEVDWYSGLKLPLVQHDRGVVAVSAT